MTDVIEDIHPVTTFKRNSARLMKRMRKTGRPLMLVANGKMEAIFPDTASYRAIAEHLDAVASIRRGLAQAKKGIGRPVDEVFNDLEREA